VVRTICHHRGFNAPRFPAEQLGLFQAYVGGRLHLHRHVWIVFTMFLLFMRFLPMIAISEVKGVTPQADPHHPLGGAKHEEALPDDED